MDQPFWLQRSEPEQAVQAVQVEGGSGNKGPDLKLEGPPSKTSKSNRYSLSLPLSIIINLSLSLYIYYILYTQIYLCFSRYLTWSSVKISPTSNISYIPQARTRLTSMTVALFDGFST